MTWRTAPTLSRSCATLRCRRAPSSARPSADCGGIPVTGTFSHRAHARPAPARAPKRRFRSRRRHDRRDPSRAAPALCRHDARQRSFTPDCSAALLRAPAIKPRRSPPLCGAHLLRQPCCICLRRRLGRPRRRRARPQQGLSARRSISRPASSACGGNRSHSGPELKSMLTSITQAAREGSSTRGISDDLIAG